MGESTNGAKLRFDRRIRLEFRALPSPRTPLRPVGVWTMGTAETASECLQESR